MLTASSTRTDRDDPFSMVVPIRISARQFIDLGDLCEQRGVTPSAILETLLAGYLNTLIQRN